MESTTASIASHPAASPTPQRWSELDGIRCFAVAGVLAVHFDPENFATLPFGDWGVQIFFTLSGFLISTGLWQARARIRSKSSRAGREIKNFFIRRALRLWPIYYATIAVTFIGGVAYSSQLLPWNLTFTTNLIIYLNNSWPDLHSHLWTLSIEHQFYLLWPFVLLFLSNRKTLSLVLFLIVSAPILRAWEYAAYPGPDEVRARLLPMCSDYFAWGALLAHSDQLRLNWVKWRHVSGLIAIGLLGIILWWRQATLPSPLHAALEGTGVGIAAMLLIAHCTNANGDSLLRRFLRFHPFVYIGIISYGIYLIHNYCHWLGPALLRRIIGQGYFESHSAHLLWLTSLTLLLSVLSWHCFEKPLASWGRKHLLARRPAIKTP